jgi:hypothetical protein
MMEEKILISVNKFKELLIHSWHLLPESKQMELVKMGIYPKN